MSEQLAAFAALAGVIIAWLESQVTKQIHELQIDNAVTKERMATLAEKHEELASLVNALGITADKRDVD